MKEYNWSKKTLEAGLVPQESLPKRIALTATGIVLKNASENKKELLVCNPHPDTWNSWMLPYGSLIIEANLIEGAITFEELTKSIEKLCQENFPKYESSALMQIQNMTGINSSEFVLNGDLTNFSLKYSQSANVWTAYCFMYHVSTNGNEIKPTVQTHWLPLDTNSINEVKSTKMLSNLKVAENIFPILDTII